MEEDEGNIKPYHLQDGTQGASFDSFFHFVIGRTLKSEKLCSSNMFFSFVNVSSFNFVCSKSQFSNFFVCVSANIAFFFHHKLDFLLKTTFCKLTECKCTIWAEKRCKQQTRVDKHASNDATFCVIYALYMF